MPTYRATIETTFTASHALRLPDGSYEPIHSHDWQVTVTVRSDQLDDMDCVMDFHELQKIVAGVIDPWHKQHLNDVPPFADQAINPSAERVAEQIALAIKPQLPIAVTLDEIRLGEAPGCIATFLP